MKKRLLFSFCISALFSFSQSTLSSQRLENLKAFSKLYGYVRYFHPSDEAAQIDWDKFAIYGSQQIENASSSDELINGLNKLFLPIAPSIKLFKSNEKVVFDVNSITPSNLKDYKEIYWQHLGLGLSKESVYQSVRVNRASKDTKTTGFNSVCKQIDLMLNKNKEFIFKAHVKIVGNETSGYLWVREDLEQGGVGYFNNMHEQPITSEKWEEYTIKGRMGANGKLVNIGLYVMGGGSMFIDNMSLSFKNDKGEWVEVYKNDFENDKVQKEPSDLIHGIGKGGSGTAGVCEVVSEEAQSGKNCLFLALREKQNTSGSKINKSIFDFKPKPGECITKSINSDLSCTLPINLYGTDEGTFPKGDESQLKLLMDNLQKLKTSSASDLYVRLADVIMIYNIMQHFYPYFDVVKTDWNEAFVVALNESYDCKDPLDFLNVIRKFTAKLKDGHVWVSYFNENKGYVPALVPEIIENKIVITNVLSESINIPVGSVIDKVNSIPAGELVKKESQYIPAPTVGWLNHILQAQLFRGQLNDSLIFDFTKPDGTSGNIVLKRTMSIPDRHSKTDKLTTIKKLSQDVYYINIDKASMKTINDSMEKLKTAKAIICDLRGYPNGNHDLIRHFLKGKDTAKAWMRIPEIIYPDYQPSGFENEGWALKPEKPYLSAKIIFIIDGSAISYAESYMGFIEGYKLATIVGQPTAGSNGNVNNFVLPGGYSARFTGMKVVRHNGTQQHAIGILPNVYVNKTIKGVIEGRDEFLEKAIEIANQH